ncbi:spectrin beta chain [Anaeramoeba ignava]|uniref:Spectrin beta chain n=1 Tax=Anaeramoeba ignava TaxID=1746090 RepID=A0A9Q0LRD4_ANAIG|nr:spectrin beta chain [Anaeramoeba ignava]
MSVSKHSSLRYSTRPIANKTKDLQLHTQKKIFSLWVRKYLSKHTAFRSIRRNCEDGIALIELVQNLSGKNIPTYHQKTKTKMQKIDNLNYFIQFALDLTIPLEISPQDIIDQNLQKISQMIWTIAIFFRLKKIPANIFDPREILLLWCQISGEKYSIQINNFSSSFMDGIAFCAIIDFHKPGFIFPSVFTKQLRNKKRLKIAFDKATELGVPQILDPSDFTETRISERGVMLYIAEMYYLLATQKDIDEMTRRITKPEENSIENQPVEPLSPIEPPKIVKPTEMNFNQGKMKPKPPVRDGFQQRSRRSGKFSRKFQQIYQQIQKQYEDKIIQIFNVLKTTTNEMENVKEKIEEIKSGKILGNEMSLSTLDPEETKKKMVEYEAENRNFKKNIQESENKITSQQEQFRTEHAKVIEETNQISHQIEEEQNSRESRLEDIEKQSKENLKKTKEENKRLREKNEILHLQLENKRQEEQLRKQTDPEISQLQKQIEANEQNNAQIKMKLQKLETVTNEMEEEIKETKINIQKNQQVIRKAQQEIEQLNQNIRKEKETNTTNLRKKQEQIQDLRKRVEQMKSKSENAKLTLRKMLKTKQPKLGMELDKIEAQIEEGKKKEKQLAEVFRQEEYFSNVLEERNKRLHNLTQKKNEFQTHLQLGNKLQAEQIQLIQKETNELQQMIKDSAHSYAVKMRQLREELQNISKQNIEKDERILSIQETLQDMQSKYDAQEKLFGSLVEKKNQELLDLQEKFVGVQKTNRQLTSQLEEIVMEYNLELEGLKERVDDIKTVQEEKHKKKKSKTEQKFIDFVDLVLIKLDFEKQNSQQKQMNNDYQRLHEILMSKSEIIGSQRKILTNLQEKRDAKNSELKELENKYASLKAQFNNMVSEDSLFSEKNKEKLEKKIKIANNEKSIVRFERDLLDLQSRQTRYQEKLIQVESSLSSFKLLSTILSSISDTHGKINKILQQNQRLNDEQKSMGVTFSNVNEISDSIQFNEKKILRFIFTIQQIDSMLF